MPGMTVSRHDGYPEPGSPGGIVVRCPSNVELAEEAPYAYKDIERVVNVVDGAGLAHKVARLGPLGVVKG